MPKPFMRTRIAAATLALPLLLSSPAPAQRGPATAAGPTVSLAQILAGVPDSAMRARWVAVARTGLPALPVSVLPARSLEARRRVVMRDTGELRVPDRLPPGTVADVRVYTPLTNDSLAVRLEVRSLAAGRISAVAAGRQVQILYRLPGAGSQELALRGTGDLSLTARSELAEGSMRRESLLAEGGRALLFFLSDGSAEPYRRDFPALHLSLRQLAPRGDSLSAAAITFAGQEFVLRPGESRVVRDAEGALEVFLGPTYYTPRERIAVVEGDPYHVMLMVFRRAGQ